MVSDIGEAQLVNAVVQPYGLPLELHGGPARDPARSRSPPRSERLRRGGPRGETDGPPGEAAAPGVHAAGGPPARAAEGVRGRGRGRHGAVRGAESGPVVPAAGRHRPRRNETAETAE